MLTTYLEVSCMLCGTEVGELRDGKFWHHRGCAGQPRLDGGRLRCCRCGGSLFAEPVTDSTYALQARARTVEARRTG